MSAYRSRIGVVSEKVSLSFLKDLGYEIIESNYHCRYGEIDIIAADKEVLVFVEVRCRTTKSFETPIESITSNKKNKIIATANDYIFKKELFDKACRFDVIEVTSKEGKLLVKEHIKNAFEID